MGKTAASWAAALALAGCVASGADDPAFRRRSVIGGAIDTDPAHDAIVFHLNTENGCGATGTLVSPRVVVVAAACLEGPPEPDEVTVVFGADLAEPEAPGRVRSVHVHPDYDGADSYSAQIAALVLTEDAPDEIIPIPALSADRAVTVDDVGEEVTFVGFGRESWTDVGGVRRSATGTVAYVCNEGEPCVRGYPGTFVTRCPDGRPASGDGPVLLRRDGLEQLAGIALTVESGVVPYAIALPVSDYEAFLSEIVESSFSIGPSDGVDADLDAADEGEPEAAAVVDAGPDRAAGRPPMAVGGCRCQAAARASQGIGVASLLSALVASQRRGDRFWAVH